MEINTCKSQTSGLSPIFISIGPLFVSVRIKSGGPLFYAALTNCSPYSNRITRNTNLLALSLNTIYSRNVWTNRSSTLVQSYLACSWILTCSVFKSFIFHWINNIIFAYIAHKYNIQMKEEEECTTTNNERVEMKKF